MILPQMLLQKPSPNSKAHEHSKCLARHLEMWKAGDILSLLEEGRAIQSRLHVAKPRPSALNQEHTARAFAKLMFHGRVKAALRLITEQSGGGILQLDSCVLGSLNNVLTVLTVRDVLLSKHPSGQPVSANALYNTTTEPPIVHPVVFEAIDATAIKRAALHTDGAAGPSGIDARGWRRLCASFQSDSDDLCHSLALLARRLCTEFVCPMALVACRLIALDKKPGVCPIGIGELPWRIIAKAVLSVISGDIQETTGSLQLCSGQTSGIEAAVHAMHEAYNDDSVQAILLVDASNAFNSLNREAALCNIQHLCPSLATILINTYRQPANLYVDGTTLLSREGTTQGDPLAMSMYSVGILPLIHHVSGDVKQVWYADDATAAGKLSNLNLREWWDNLVSSGPDFGYFVNASKTSLVVKEGHLADAEHKCSNFHRGKTTSWSSLRHRGICS